MQSAGGRFLYLGSSHTLMQTYALTVDKFLDHAAKWLGNREVVTAGAGRIGYAALRARSNRLSGALVALGLHLGDRVAHACVEHTASSGDVLRRNGRGLRVPHAQSTPHGRASGGDGERGARIACSRWVRGLQIWRDELVSACPCVEIVVFLDGVDAVPRSIAGRRTFEFEAFLAEYGRETALGRIRREYAGWALLHVRDDRRAQGRALHPSLQLSSYAACAAGGCDCA